VLQSDDQYLCVFGSNLSVSIGIASPNEVRCQTPRLSSDVVPFNKGNTKIRNPGSLIKGKITLDAKIVFGQFLCLYSAGSLSRFYSEVLCFLP